MRIAVIGAGVSGLVCARLLGERHEVDVFEAGDEVGGHAHTSRLCLDDGDVDVDTGFIVYNERNYPLFTRLLQDLGVATQKSEMSFSVARLDGSFEYRPTRIASALLSRANLLDRSFHALLRDVVRFNRRARSVLADPSEDRTLGELLAEGSFSKRLASDFVLPLGSAIWSADPTTLCEMPLSTYAAFMANHGLLSIGDRPTWRTVSGGSRRYVAALVAASSATFHLLTAVTKVTRRQEGIELQLAGAGSASYDRIVLAAHSDQALAMLSDPTRAERDVLGAIGYKDNVATLHSDERLLPKRHSARASWNYHLLDDATPHATLTYHMNRLQSLASHDEVLVSLNMDAHIDERFVHARYHYSHPVLDSAAISAQSKRVAIQGRMGTYYCGAYWGYGFHEDGVRSAHEVADLIGAE